MRSLGISSLSLFGRVKGSLNPFIVLLFFLGVIKSKPSFFSPSTTISTLVSHYTPASLRESKLWKTMTALGVDITLYLGKTHCCELALKSTMDPEPPDLHWVARHGRRSWMSQPPRLHVVPCQELHSRRTLPRTSRLFLYCCLARASSSCSCQTRIRMCLFSHCHGHHREITIRHNTRRDSAKLQSKYRGAAGGALDERGSIRNMGRVLCKLGEGSALCWLVSRLLNSHFLAYDPIFSISAQLQ